MICKCGSTRFIREVVILEHIDNLNECSGKERGEVKRTVCASCFRVMK